MQGLKSFHHLCYTLHYMRKLFTQIFKEYFSHNPFSLAAALSFYAVIAFPAFVMFLVFLSAIFVSQSSLTPQMYSQIEAFLGPGTKTLIEQIFNNLPSIHELKLVSIVTLLAFLFGGLGFFEQLQTTFHTFWGITLKKKLGLRGYIKNQFFLVLTMLSCAAIFIASTGIELFFSLLPKLPLIGFFLGILFMMMIFTFLYKFLTQANVQWKECLFGASITTLLFTLGKYIALTLLSNNATLSSYGATSTIIIFLLFVYYSSQAIFIGAVATKIHAKSNGRKIRPSKNAVDTESVWNQLLGKV